MPPVFPSFLLFLLSFFLLTSSIEENQLWLYMTCWPLFFNFYPLPWYNCNGWLWNLRRSAILLSSIVFTFLFCTPILPTPKHYNKAQGVTFLPVFACLYLSLLAYLFVWSAVLTYLYLVHFWTFWQKQHWWLWLIPFLLPDVFDMMVTSGSWWIVPYWFCYLLNCFLPRGVCMK